MDLERGRIGQGTVENPGFDLHLQRHVPFSLIVVVVVDVDVYPLSLVLCKCKWYWYWKW